MRSNLTLFRKTNSSQYSVTTEEFATKHGNGKTTYKTVVSSFLDLVNGKQIVLDVIDTGRILNWSGKEVDRILLEISPYLNDFASYKWSDIKKPIVDYWVQKQRASVEQQKQEGQKTIWTPGGDSTLLRIAEFISYILIAKFEILKDESIVSDLEIKDEGFEREFNNLVLLPIQTYVAIGHVVNGEKSNKEKVKEIIDQLVSFTLHSSGSTEKILDPDFDDKTPFLTEYEERQLAALWTIYNEKDQEIKSNKQLSKIEQNIKFSEFCDSPHVKRLNKLNSRRSYGGTLHFEEKEKRKLKRVEQISEIIEKTLITWGFSSDDIDSGLAYYQLLFEKEAIERWNQNKEFDEMITKAESNMKIMNRSLKGIWDSDSLQLLGIILGIGLGVGFGFASIATDDRFIIGFASGIASIAILLGLLKIKAIRKSILIFSNWFLK